MDTSAFEPQADGDDVLLHLERTPDDGDVPVRSLYWFATEPFESGWRVRVPRTRLVSWLQMAVEADFTGGDKRSWRLATRFAQVRLRRHPPALGVSPPVLGELRFERSEV